VSVGGGVGFRCPFGADSLRGMGTAGCARLRTASLHPPRQAVAPLGRGGAGVAAGAGVRG